jgi:hypothetical protein
MKKLDAGEALLSLGAFSFVTGGLEVIMMADLVCVKLLFFLWLWARVGARLATR